MGPYRSSKRILSLCESESRSIGSDRGGGGGDGEGDQLPLGVALLGESGSILAMGELAACAESVRRTKGVRRTTASRTQFDSSLSAFPFRLRSGTTVPFDGYEGSSRLS